MLPPRSTSEVAPPAAASAWRRTASAPSPSLNSRSSAAKAAASSRTEATSPAGVEVELAHPRRRTCQHTDVAHGKFERTQAEALCARRRPRRRGRAQAHRFARQLEHLLEVLDAGVERARARQRRSPASGSWRSSPAATASSTEVSSEKSGVEACWAARSGFRGSPSQRISPTPPPTSTSTKRCAASAL